MHQQISKRIIIYLFLFVIFSTTSNNQIDQINIFKIKNIEVSGLSIIENKKLVRNINHINEKNLFFLSKQDIKREIYANEIVEKFSIFVIYPSTLKIKIEQTKFLAATQKNGQYYFIGSNGKFIKTNDLPTDIPFIFGNINEQQFLKFKKIIDDSNYDYSKIKNLYFFQSERWDFENYDGILIKLPKLNAKESLDILDGLLNKEEFKDIKIFDFRPKSQIIMNE